MKYLNKSFSVPSAGIYMNDGWWNDPPPRISKGEWVKMPGAGRERYVPKGKPIPREATRKYKNMNAVITGYTCPHECVPGDAHPACAIHS